MGQLIAISHVAEMRRHQLASLLRASTDRLERQRIHVERALGAIDQIQRLASVLDDRLGRRNGLGGRVEQELERRMARRIAEIAPLVEALAHSMRRPF